MTDFEEIEAEIQRAHEVGRLKDSNRRLMIQLGEAKQKKADLVDAVYRAALDGISTLSFDPVPKPPVDRRRRAPEIAIAWLSDWQLAKVTKSYNSQVCEERIALYADKLLKLTEIQRKDHPVRELHVWITGDLVEGELIFPGQEHLIDASLYRQVTVDGPRILVDFLVKMLANFERIKVTAVIGNHGAMGGPVRRNYDPESNADRMLYRIVQQIMDRVPGGDRINWVIPDGGRERNWYAVDKVGSTRVLLLHGDQFRGGAGFPWYSVHKKVGGWKMGAIEEEFDDVAFGHWHQPTRLTLNSVTARCSGSTESHNDFAQELLAAVGRPSQWCLFADDKVGITAEYVVWLDTE